MSDTPEEQQPKTKRPKPKRGRRKQFVPYKRRSQSKPRKTTDEEQPSTSAGSEAGLLQEGQHAASDEEMQLSDHFTNEGSSEQIPCCPEKPEVLEDREGFGMQNLEAGNITSELISAPSVHEEYTPRQIPCSHEKPEVLEDMVCWTLRLET